MMIRALAAVTHSIWYFFWLYRSSSHLDDEWRPCHERWLRIDGIIKLTTRLVEAALASWGRSKAIICRYEYRGRPAWHESRYR